MTEARLIKVDDFHRLRQLARANDWISTGGCNLDAFREGETAGRRLLVLAVTHTEELTGFAIGFACDRSSSSFVYMRVREAFRDVAAVSALRAA